jgi:hypothetical protein
MDSKGGKSEEDPRKPTGQESQVFCSGRFSPAQAGVYMQHPQLLRRNRHMPRSIVVSNAAFGFSRVAFAIPTQHVPFPTLEMPFAALESTLPTQHPSFPT